MTYESIEYDRPAEQATGILRTHPSPFGGRQCEVAGMQVDPETVLPTEEEEPGPPAKKAGRSRGKK